MINNEIFDSLRELSLFLVQKESKHNERNAVVHKNSVFSSFITRHYQG